MEFFGKSVQNDSLRKNRAKSACEPRRTNELRPVVAEKPRAVFWRCFLFSVFSLGILLEISFAAQTEEKTSNAERLFNGMFANVQLLQSIEAGIRMDVAVLGKEYSVRGKYEEQRLQNPPPGDFQRSMYRLDLNFVMDSPSLPGTEPNRLTIVCHPTSDRDSGRLWQYVSIEGDKTVKYFKLAALEDAVRRSNKQALLGSVGEIKNLGGLLGTLKQIARFYEFTESPKETVMEGGSSLSVWKLVGTLRPEYWDKMVKVFGGLEPKTQNFPGQMPTDIEIFIGRDNAFPYKIEYQNRLQKESTTRTLLTRIVYFDVSCNGEPIPEFKFSAFDKGESPEGVFQTTDETARLIRSLGLQ